FPAGTDLLFFVLPKKVSKERRARDGDFPLNLCDRAEREANSLRSDRPPSFFRPLTKIQGAIKGLTSKEKGQPVARLALSFGRAFSWCGFCPLTFLP
ncbi:hypothetical protein, partial [Ralstonia pickettii]|uniref:hypothetical protein n=1 Tax=Ralstonia pickettii TaxID=329 RepID=UPI001BAF6F26